VLSATDIDMKLLVPYESLVFERDETTHDRTIIGKGAFGNVMGE